MHVKQKPRLHRDWIDPDALDIVRQLQKSGFTTYLVGGCVRDLLVGIQPKDFDVATSALPNQVRRNTSQAYVIGRRFRLVLVKRGNQTFEVATFRRAPTPEELNPQDSDEVPSGDNFFGTPKEDAVRRDFTINGLFYDPVSDELLDHCDGVRDIEDRVVRMIGDPSQRLMEDPIRIFRALRLAHKLEFSIEPKLREGMVLHAEELNKSALPRKREEFLKILRLQDCSGCFREAFDLGILKYGCPTLHEIYSDPHLQEEFDTFLSRITEFSLEATSPTHLFGILILAYIRTCIDPDPLKNLSEENLENHSGLNSFCKNELGMFNLEIKSVYSALRLQPELFRTFEFEKRGRRRQNGFLRQESLPLAIQFAKADHSLSGAQVHFWEKRLSLLSGISDDEELNEDPSLD